MHEEGAPWAQVQVQAENMISSSSNSSNNGSTALLCIIHINNQPEQERTDRANPRRIGR
jgi:hypothetical protein